MKRLLLGIVPLACIFVYAPVMAAVPSARVPPNLCFSGAGTTHQLVLKNFGNLKTSGSAVKQYGIFGHSNTGQPTPVQGTAYVIPGLTVLHGTMTASYAVSGVVRDVRFEFFIDLPSQTGTTTAWLQTSAGGNTVLSSAVTVGNCANLAVTGSLGEGEGFIDQQTP